MTMVVVYLILAAPAYAQAQSGSPWENAVNVLMAAFTTTIARGLSLISMSSSEGSHSPSRKARPKRLLAGILFGVGMAIGAVKFLSLDFKMDDLVQMGTLDRELAALLSRTTPESTQHLDKRWAVRASASRRCWVYPPGRDSRMETGSWSLQIPPRFI